MAFLIELSGEQPELAVAEAVGAAEALGDAPPRVVDRDPGLLVLDAPGVDARALAARLGLAHAVSTHWFTTDADPADVPRAFEDASVNGRTFRVRARRVERPDKAWPVSETERAVGQVLARTGPVDLKDPDVEVRVLASDRVHAGALLAEVDRRALDARAVKHRPFFSPVGLHPKFVRALLNLARVRPGDRVADPFTGTGGLVLEAGLMGARVLASDLDARMVVGTRDTLAHYAVADATETGGVVAVDTRDVGELPEFVDAHGGPVDVVVTDPPYGKASTTNFEEVDALYERFLDAAHAALKPGGRVAMVVPEERHVDMVRARFDVRDPFALRVHRSMTRHFLVGTKRA